jgi:hypothetical protein
MLLPWCTTRRDTDTGLWGFCRERGYQRPKSHRLTNSLGTAGADKKCRLPFFNNGKSFANRKLNYDCIPTVADFFCPKGTHRVFSGQEKYLEHRDIIRKMKDEMRVAALEKKHAEHHFQYVRAKQRYARAKKKKTFSEEEIVKAGLTKLPDPRGAQICQEDLTSELQDPKKLKIMCPVGWILMYVSTVPYCERGGPEGYCLTLEDTKKWGGCHKQDYVPRAQLPNGKVDDVGTVFANCPAGTVLTGGGIRMTKRMCTEPVMVKGEATLPSPLSPLRRTPFLTLTVTGRC